MSISAVSGVSKLNDDAPPAATRAASAITPFSQQLDAQTSAAKGHHHASANSVKSSASSAASAAGVSTGASLASSVASLLR